MEPLDNVVWVPMHPRATLDHLGFIPTFLDLREPGDAVEQLDRNYAHGGGFCPTGVKFNVAADRSKLVYPGSLEDGEEDEVYPLLWQTKFRDEWVCVYHYAWVGVFKPDGSHVIARMD